MDGGADRELPVVLAVHRLSLDSIGDLGKPGRSAPQEFQEQRPRIGRLLGAFGVRHTLKFLGGQLGRVTQDQIRTAEQIRVDVAEWFNVNAADLKHLPSSVAEENVVETAQDPGSEHEQPEEDVAEVAPAGRDLGQEQGSAGHQRHPDRGERPEPADLGTLAPLRTDARQREGMKPRASA